MNPAFNHCESAAGNSWQRGVDHSRTSPYASTQLGRSRTAGLSSCPTVMPSYSPIKLYHKVKPSRWLHHSPKAYSRPAPLYGIRPARLFDRLQTFTEQVALTLSMRRMDTMAYDHDSKLACNATATSMSASAPHNFLTSPARSTRRLAIGRVRLAYDNLGRLSYHERQLVY